MHDRTSVPIRLWGVVVAQLLLGIAPLASYSLPQHTGWMVQSMWALSAISFAQLMLLSFWVGMGNNAGIVRALGGFAGIAYISIWPVASPYVSPHFEGQLLPPFAKELFTQFATYAGFALLLSGCFLLLRWKGTQLTHLSKLNSTVAPPRVNYSIFHLLILMSTCAFVLGLTRAAHPTDETSTGSTTLSYAALLILALLGMVINSMGAAWASLSLNSPWSRLALVSAIALLLGIAFAVSTRLYATSWRIFIPASLIPVLSTATVVVTLLVVRSFGYRLVPNTLVQADP